MATKQITTKTVEERDEEEDTDEAAAATPLFDRTRDKKSKSIATISIRRTDPDEGHLGVMPPDTTEAEIRAKYGGGEFTIQGKNSSGQIVHTMTGFKIAGDPVFQSEIAEARWNRLNRVNGTRTTDGGGVKEVLAMIEDRDDRRREDERDRRQQERQEALDREAKLAREAEAREDRRRKEDEAREDRRRVEAQADEERRARLHREDLERVEKAAAAQLAQTQQFFTQLQAMNKRDERAAGDADPIKILTTGMDLALKMQGAGGGGGEPTDALTALLSRLPETLAEVRSTAKEAYNEIKGKKVPRAIAGAGGPDEVTITGPVATRFKQMIAILQKSGKDPEQVIDGLAGHVIGLAKRQSSPGATTAKPRPAGAAPKTSGPKRAAARRSAPVRRKKARTDRRAPSPARSG